MIDALLLWTGEPGALKRTVQIVSLKCEVAKRLPDDALPVLAHAAGPPPGLPEAILTISGSQSDILEAFTAIVDHLPAGSPEERPSILVTRRHSILPGRDTIKLFYGLHRLERLSLEAFHDYWLNRHADIGRRLIPPYSYDQLHTDPAATASLAQALGMAASSLDGVAELHFPDLDALIAQLSRPDVVEEALADEREFIDHARSVFWAYRIE